MVLPLAAQAQGTEKGIGWTDVVPWALALVAIAFSIYQWRMRKKEHIQNKLLELHTEKEFEKETVRETATSGEKKYRQKLKKELEHISLLGSPDLESSRVKLEDTFVSLCISEAWRNEERYGPEQHKRLLKMEQAREGHLSPEQVMKKAFKKNNLLLVIGDPGSGKTTLMKYYALQCLDTSGAGWKKLGFKKPVFPFYLPLRELRFDKNDEPESLPKGLEQWAGRFLLDIDEKQFHAWLQGRKTLLLLDGLDEISGLKQRRNLCRWINSMSMGLDNACIVVTSRSTGYRKLDGVELDISHLRADILDFSMEQQEKFLTNWFRASLLSGTSPLDVGEREWRSGQMEEADGKVKGIVSFLKGEANKAIQELASVPMLLEIMAVLWKDRQLLPQTRIELYNAALNYLLGYRARSKGIDLLVTPDEARRVMAPVALWMQEDVKKDEAGKEEIGRVLQPLLDTFGRGLSAGGFCDYLRDRAGLLADYDKDHYIFRHKSFREFLAGIQLRDAAHQSGRMEKLVEVFTDPWWEETLRFFMCKSNDAIFDKFMRLFFQVPEHKYLEAHQQKLLLNMVRDAPQKRLDALVQLLNDPQLDDTRRQYVLDCLKTIGTPEAIEAIKGAWKDTWSDKIAGKAKDIVFWRLGEGAVDISPQIFKPLDGEAKSFRNPFEGNVEYIKIPGNTFTYSVTKKQETVPDVYVCKYPVTNERYRRFIRYLSGKEKELVELLPLERFSSLLREFAANHGYDGFISEKFQESLGETPPAWQENLRSGSDDNKKFNGAEQPVVDINWYGARVYCYWLSCLEAAVNDKALLDSVPQLAKIYRLPTEMEWEWAAGGNPDGTVRTYPWPPDRGEPSSKLANYDENVGTTTPVGSYPEGATPLGLMDMAGNVWEWMDNYEDKEKEWLALRGGSWINGYLNLRCSARYIFHPHHWSNYVGFRPFRPVIKDGR